MQNVFFVIYGCVKHVCLVCVYMFLFESLAFNISLLLLSLSCLLCTDCIPGVINMSNVEKMFICFCVVSTFSYFIDVS